jgi:xanthine dehydrogenase accessory factor
MNFWKKTYQKLQDKQALVLLLVVESKGSSPGRQGFKMVVTSNEIFGSIGGGIMEYRLVEEAKKLLYQDFEPYLKRQIHKGKITAGSGMICSGEQTILFYYLNKNHLKILQNIINSKAVLTINPSSFSLDNATVLAKKQQWQFVDDDNWQYQEQLQFQNRLYIFGAGHVGLALSKIANCLDFEIHLFDNREGLNTFEQNDTAHYKTIIDYKNSLKHIKLDAQAYIVIMTNSFVEDSIILAQFLDKKTKYLGVLGSKAKLKTMFDAFEAKGISQEQLAQVHAPIGLKIHSKTPEEIAISILGEIIQVQYS